MLLQIDDNCYRLMIIITDLIIVTDPWSIDGRDGEREKTERSGEEKGAEKG